MNWLSIAEFLNLMWVLIAVVAGIYFFSAVKGINGTAKTFAQSARKQTKFWKCLGILTSLYLLVIFGLKMYFHHETPLPINEMISTVPEPKFSCSLVEKRGQIWHIIGPVTIGGTVFTDVSLTPHSFKAGNIDVYTFLDIKCGQ